MQKINFEQTIKLIHKEINVKLVKTNKELDKWIRKNTIEKFGPVRSLKPEMVFEISFEKIQISKRHKSGIAVRFPRITKWRKDKKINDADSLENAYELMKKIS